MDSQFKIVLVGDKGVGKSTFIKRHAKGTFDARYIPTMGVDVTPLTFYTNYGKIVFKVWDCAGDPNFGGLRDEYYQQAHGCICMFDSTNDSRNGVKQWMERVRNVVPNIPIVVCGNKLDLEHATPFAPITFGAKFYGISARSNYNFEKPFLELAKILMKNENLEFVDAPALIPNVIPFTDHFTPPLMPNITITQQEQVCCWMKIPGYKIKVTYEFHPDNDQDK
jgi:GTP-binding nuclear protein Ran